MKSNKDYMIAKKAEYPFEGYYLYVVFHKGEGRYYANLIPIDGKKSDLKRKTISYARYLVSVKENRILDKNEQVDHIDNDKTNDNIDNLQILTLQQNNFKEAKRRGRRIVFLKCPWCGKIFVRCKNKTHLIKTKHRYTSCSRSCGAKFSREMQLHPYSIKVKDGLKENVISEYTTH